VEGFRRGGDLARVDGWIATGVAPGRRRVHPLGFRASRRNGSALAFRAIGIAIPEDDALLQDALAVMRVTPLGESCEN
jgi:hypothetical protein